MSRAITGILKRNVNRPFDPNGIQALFFGAAIRNQVGALRGVSRCLWGLICWLKYDGIFCCRNGKNHGKW